MLQLPFSHCAFFLESLIYPSSNFLPGIGRTNPTLQWCTSVHHTTSASTPVVGAFHSLWARLFQSTHIVLEGKWVINPLHLLSWQTLDRNGPSWSDPGSTEVCLCVHLWMCVCLHARSEQDAQNTYLSHCLLKMSARVSITKRWCQSMCAGRFQCPRQMGEIPVKCYLCLWTLFSYVF